MFMVGRHPSRTQGPKLRKSISLSKDSNLPGLSFQATIGRNSQFHNLTAGENVDPDVFVFVLPDGKETLNAELQVLLRSGDYRKGVG